MVGVVARVVIKVKIDIKNGFGIWLDYGDSITLEDIGYPSSMLYDNSIVSTCESTPHTPFCEGFNKGSNRESPQL
jgi:hypothetical protein